MRKYQMMEWVPARFTLAMSLAINHFQTSAKFKLVYRIFLGWLICCISLKSTVAQIINLDIEGHAIQRGSIDIAHQTDSTSLFIGLRAGKDQLALGLLKRNTHIGYSSGMGSEGLFNTFIGAKAGQNNLGTTNTFFGASSGANNAGNLNTFFGHLSGQSVTEDSNSIAGYQAGMNLTNGSKNSILGSNAGALLMTGDLNTIMGQAAGSLFSSGNRNTFIGYQADQLNATKTLDKAIAIGYKAKVDCDNCAVFGGSGTDEIKLGVGLINPSTSMHIINGHARLDSGAFSSWGPIILHPDIDQSGDDITSFRNSVGSEIARFHSNGFLGIGSNNPDDAVDVVGDVDATGCIQEDDGTLIGGTCLSDVRLKKDIYALNNQLNKILILRPVRYQWKDRVINQKSEIGFIAQDVEQEIPEMVTSDKKGVKHIRYDISLTIRILKAVQEQQKIMQTQKEEIERLKTEWIRLKQTLDEYYSSK